MTKTFITTLSIITIVIGRPLEMCSDDLWHCCQLPSNPNHGALGRRKSIIAKSTKILLPPNYTALGHHLHIKTSLSSHYLYIGWVWQNYREIQITICKMMRQAQTVLDLCKSSITAFHKSHNLFFSKNLRCSDNQRPTVCIYAKSRRGRVWATCWTSSGASSWLLGKSGNAWQVWLEKLMPGDFPHLTTAWPIYAAQSWPEKTKTKTKTTCM